MGNYLDMVNRIADEALRPDLAPQIRLCIQEAIAACQYERFAFNQFHDRTFDAIPGQDHYGGADSPAIDEALVIDSLSIESGAGWRRLMRVSHDAIEAWASAGAQGAPAWFSHWGRSIRLHPTPASAHRLRIRGLFKLSPLVLDTDENAWTNEGEALIRARASAILYGQYLRDDSGLARARIQEAEAREVLVLALSRRQATGAIEAAL